MTEIRITEHDRSILEAYGRIPIAFEVRSIYVPEPMEGGLGGISLREQPVKPYIKDYDALEGGPPVAWGREFDLTHWGFLLAWQGDQAAGAAAIAWRPEGTGELGESREQPVLWDIRVLPELRGCGVGSALFRAAAEWVRARGGLRLKMETQNVNVEACKFYARMGCELGQIHRYAYAHVPHVAHETMLVWYLAL